MKDIRDWVSFAFLVASLAFASISVNNICEALFFNGKIEFYSFIVSVLAFMIHNEMYNRDESN